MLEVHNPVGPGWDPFSGPLAHGLALGISSSVWERDHTCLHLMQRIVFRPPTQVSNGFCLCPPTRYLSTGMHCQCRGRAEIEGEASEL